MSKDKHNGAGMADDTLSSEQIVKNVNLKFIKNMGTNSTNVPIHAPFIDSFPPDVLRFPLILRGKEDISHAIYAS
jgi:hypothetical protein